MAIQKESVQSLLLRLRSSSQDLATATGFIADSSSGPLLLTNRHVLRGRNNLTDQPLSSSGAIPDEVAIIHNRANQPGQWIERIEPLYSGQNHLWHEHPTLLARADMVALSLTRLDDVALHPHTLGVGDPPLTVGPADILSVIGFPFGLQGGGSLAIWATGFVASEPTIDFQDLPMFLIDCRSRPGQSGSAVIAHRHGGMLPLEDGSSALYNGPVSRFLGMYSGRVNDQSDLGMVWKATALKQLVDSIS